MTDGREPRVQKLSPGEIERLRQEMRQSMSGQEPNWHTGAL